MRRAVSWAKSTVEHMALTLLRCIDLFDIFGHLLLGGVRADVNTKGPMSFQS
jgi:hypothetical protein